MVVALLTQSAQLDEEPCQNFRRHVCGWWYGTNVHSGGYVGGNRAAFHARLGLHLKRLASNSRLVGSGQYQMARFYSACQLYARRQSQTRIEEVLQISGIGAMPWSRAKNSEELFVLMVAEVLRSGLTSIISVKWSDSRLYVDAGTSLSSTMRGLYDHLSTFVTDVLIALGLQEDATLLSAAIRLDSEVERVLSAPPSEFSAFTVCELPPVGYCEHWVRGLNLGLDNRAIISQSTSVMARGLVKIKTLISTLGSANLTVVSIYTLLIPLSQVMRYAYAITPDKTRSRSQDGDLCLRETSERFPTLFPVWVADTVETAESRGYFDEMVAALQQATAELHQIAGGVVFSPADIAESRMKIEYMNKYKPTLSAVVPLSSDDFLRNVITLSGQVHLTHDDAALRRSLQQLSGELRYDGEVFLVPSMYLTGDLLHSEASEPMLDYATAGVPVLVDWARFLVKENATLNAQLSERVACIRKMLQDSVDEGSAPELTSEILHRIALVPWALDVAFAAARMNSPLPEDNVTDVRAKEQVFFRRFCHVACGDPIADILCSHAARSSTWFASTFGCRDVPGLVCS
ncbi:uncharacterized protein LOC144144508 [Haemaphysalis longicornis]